MVQVVKPSAQPWLEGPRTSTSMSLHILSEGPSPNDFSVILLRWMKDRSFSRKTVAEISRSKEKDIIEWERGLGRPSKNQLTRLVRSFSLFAKARMPSDEEIEKNRGRRPALFGGLKAGESAPVESSPNPQPFCEVLEEMMVEEKLTKKALAELLGVSTTIITGLLNGAVPKQDTYKILVDLAPVLKGAVLPLDKPLVQKKVETSLPKAKLALSSSDEKPPVNEEVLVERATITAKLLAAAKRSPIKLPAMVGQWKNTLRFVHDHAVKRFRQRFLEGTGRGYSNEECIAIIDTLVQDAFQLGHFELLRDRETGSQVMCVAVPGPRIPNQFFGFIVHKNHPSSRHRETIITCLPAQASFSEAEIRVNQPFAGFAERFAEIRKLLPAKAGDIIPAVPVTVEAASPAEAPKVSVKLPSVVPLPIVNIPPPVPLTNLVSEAPVLKDPVRALNTLVKGTEDPIGISSDEAEIAFAYVLARKNLRIQQESLAVAEKLVELLKAKVEEAKTEVAQIHAKLEVL